VVPHAASNSDATSKTSNLNMFFIMLSWLI